jgi:hypothetical protein
MMDIGPFWQITKLNCKLLGRRPQLGAGDRPDIYSPSWGHGIVHQGNARHLMHDGYRAVLAICPTTPHTATETRRWHGVLI